MIKFVNATEMRSENASDRARVCGSVRVSADGAINRAGVQAGAATDAVQSVALFGIGEQFGAAIIEKDDVKFFGACEFVRSARAADQSVVASDGLARAGCGEHRPKQREIL